MDRQHNCPWPFCTARVDADLWGCKRHWYALPPVLRRALWEAYKPGQTVATASDAYRHASAAIDAWIYLYLQTKGALPPTGPKGGRPPSVPPQGKLPL